MKPHRIIVGPPLPYLSADKVHAHTLALHPWLRAKQVLELSLFCKSGLGAAADAREQAGRQGGGGRPLQTLPSRVKATGFSLSLSGQEGPLTGRGGGSHVRPPISTMR